MGHGLFLSHLHHFRIIDDLGCPCEGITLFLSHFLQLCSLWTPFSELKIVFLPFSWRSFIIPLFLQRKNFFKNIFLPVINTLGLIFLHSFVIAWLLVFQEIPSKCLFKTVVTTKRKFYSGCSTRLFIVRINFTITFDGFIYY